MNWGHKIVIASALFMGYIIFLVTQCMKQDIDLVDKHYYKEEIEYQKKIDKQQNSVSKDLQVSYQHSDKQVSIKFPTQTAGLKGNIQFFRPSDLKMDQVFQIATDPTGIQNIPTDGLSSGLWRIKVSWSEGDREYFKETTLVL